MRSDLASLDLLIHAVELRSRSTAAERCHDALAAASWGASPWSRIHFVSPCPIDPAAVCSHRRLAESHDAARAAAFLASDEAGFISGVEFPVDSGRTV